MQPFVMSFKKYLQLFIFYHFSFFSSQVELEKWRWYKPISQAECKNWTLSFVVTTPRTSPKKFLLTVVEIQQSPGKKQIDCKKF